MVRVLLCQQHLFLFIFFLGFMSVDTHSSMSAQPVTSTEVYTRPAISSFSAGKDTPKQAPSLWQSDTHDPSLQNKTTDGKCVTCEAAKVSMLDSTKQITSSSQCISSKGAVPVAGTLGFEDKFKTSPNSWDCDTCLVHNKPEATKCIACETPKPGTGVMPALTLPVVTDNAVTVTSSSSNTDTTVTLGFGDKFKKPKGSWDCAVCLLTNKAEDSKCVACQSEKPGLFFSFLLFQSQPLCICRIKCCIEKYFQQRGCIQYRMD